MTLKHDLADEALQAAARLGAADAEITISNSVDFEVEVAQGEVETFSLAESIGAGVRIFTEDRRMGFAYATGLTEGAGDLVQAAWQNAISNVPDPHNVLGPISGESDDDWSDQDFSQIAVEDKIDFARRLEECTLAADSRISTVQQAGYGDAHLEMTLVNSRGVKRRFRSSYCSCSVVAAAQEEGTDGEMGWEFDFARRYEDLRLEWVANTCARSIVRRLGGTPCATAAMPIVLDNYVAMQFLQTLGSGFKADNVLKGKSLYADKLGETVASEHVTIIDANDLSRGMNRAPFDGEGTPAQTTVLIENGVLKSYLQNVYTADKMGVASTANAGRGGFRSLPEVGATNFYLQEGQQGQEELFAEAGNGLFITDAMGVHTADPISGDFSFGASGLLIENGKPGRPVRGVTIAGNMKDLLARVSAVGNDLRFFGAYGAPSVLISEIMVSGD